MKLHTHPEEFRELITVVANEKHISESAVERDYYIVMMLKSLADSPYADQCVFKGGTSLSKCYPGSIDRFSEDIDLTFLGMELSDSLRQSDQENRNDHGGWRTNGEDRGGTLQPQQEYVCLVR